MSWSEYRLMCSSYRWLATDYAIGGSRRVDGIGCLTGHYCGARYRDRARIGSCGGNSKALCSCIVRAGICPRFYTMQRRRGHLRVKRRCPRYSIRQLPGWRRWWQRWRIDCCEAVVNRCKTTSRIWHSCRRSRNSIDFVARHWTELHASRLWSNIWHWRKMVISVERPHREGRHILCTTGT